MGSQTPALEKLFDEWAKKHAENISTAAPYFLPEQENPYGGFVRDGIVNLDNWKKQKVRICFILNEAGGRFDMTHYPDGFDLAAEWNEKGSFSKFMFKLCVWTKAIQDAFGAPTTYKKTEVSKVRDEIIRSIAVVNIKKSDGQRHSDFEALQRFANEDAEELRRELELVNPNIIVCCENLKFLRKPFPPKPNQNDNNQNESDTEVAPAEIETPGDSLKYVFGLDDLKLISKFTYVWGSKLVLSLWTPANFVGTISSNTINYYAVRGVVRASLKAFGEYQKRQKIKQLNEQNHQENLQKKQERQAKAAAQPTPVEVEPKAKTATKAKAAPKAEVAAEVKPKTTRAKAKTKTE